MNLKKKRLQHIEIIELKSRIKEFKNQPVEKPDKIAVAMKGYDLDYHLKPVGEKTTNLFIGLDKKIRELDQTIWRKPSKTSITYYSPERVFIYLHPQKQGIKMYVFTNAKKINGVKTPYADAPKWGHIDFRRPEDLDKVVNIVRISHELIKYAVKENLNTGWFSTPEDIITEQELTNTPEFIDDSGKETQT